MLGSRGCLEVGEGVVRRFEALVPGTQQGTSSSHRVCSVLVYVASILAAAVTIINGSATLPGPNLFIPYILHFANQPALPMTFAVGRRFWRSMHHSLGPTFSAAECQ